VKKTKTDSIISGRILIAEDDRDNLGLLEETLQKANYKTFSVCNGEEALSTAKDILPSIILLDIKMPGMDGFEVSRRLKTDQRTSAIPIILISAFTDTISKAKGFKVGAIDFISKPFLPIELLVKIKTHF